MNKRFGDIPVQENQEYIVFVESIGNKGDGICKVDNFVILVPAAIINQEYLIRVDKVKSKFAFGTILETVKKE